MGSCYKSVQVGGKWKDTLLSSSIGLWPSWHWPPGPNPIFSSCGGTLICPRDLNVPSGFLGTTDLITKITSTVFPFCGTLLSNYYNSKSQLCKARKKKGGVIFLSLSFSLISSPYYFQAQC